MSITDDNMVLPVTPMNNGGNSGFGGDWSAWIILFLFAMMFNGGWGGFGGGNQLGYDFPWLLNGQNNTDALVSNGFQNAAVQGALGDISTSLCSGFAGVNATVNGAQNALSQQLYTNQLADLERSFAAQTASTAGMSALQAQLAQCLKKISDKVKDFFCFTKFETVGTLAA